MANKRAVKSSSKRSRNLKRGKAISKARTLKAGASILLPAVQAPNPGTAAGWIEVASPAVKTI